MHKNIKNLMKSLKQLYLTDIIDEIAFKTKFLKRKTKITPELFLSLCVFGGEDLCISSLVQLKSRIENMKDIRISPQALDQRFNKTAVDFLRTVFYEMLKIQNKVLIDKESLLKNHFKAIKVVDSTSVVLPESFKNTYKGCGGSGSASAAAIKIQLQLDVLTGGFINFDISRGASNDADYLPTLEKSIEANELYLKDLGYLNLDHFRKIEELKAYYISKMKSTISIFRENENPEMTAKGMIKESTRYIKIDIQEIVEPLAEGETIELLDIYIGKNKLKTNMILTKLPQESKKNREKKFYNEIRKGKKKATDKNMFWNSINVYITNIPTSILEKEQIHDIYSLRWQVELMFKIWKSLFKINKVKKVKLERLQCFLYGRLISLLLTSSIVCTGKKIILEKTKKEISPIKSFSIVKESFNKIREIIFKGEIVLIRFLSKIIASIMKYAIKSKKKGRKTTLEIIESIKISEFDLESLVI
jgi:hypothetical protein